MLNLEYFAYNSSECNILRVKNYHVTRKFIISNILDV